MLNRQSWLGMAATLSHYNLTPSRHLPGESQPEYDPALPHEAASPGARENFSGTKPERGMSRTMILTGLTP